MTALTQIGFTEYEAKIYLALLREHPATGYQISKISSVPRSMVYENLGRLHARGIVLETTEGRATLYQPLPPKTLLSRQQTEHERLISGLRDGLNALYTEIQDDRVWSIEGRTAVIAYATRMLQGANSDIYLILTDDDLAALRKEITDASARGIIVNTLLTEEGNLACGRVARHPPLESELQELTGTLLVAIEGGEVLIASPTSNQVRRATITRNPDLVLIARQFVWMELFTQRIYARLGADLLDRLEPEDKRIFESLGT